jgi:hypothetical protein
LGTFHHRYGIGTLAGAPEKAKDTFLKSGEINTLATSKAYLRIDSANSHDPFNM